MAKDFRASQIETTKLIASGGLSGNGLRAGNTLGLAIYSASMSNSREGGISDSTMFTNVGKDVYLFISGTQSDPTKGAHSEASDAVVLFGGDVVVSGTLYAERQVIEVDSVADGNFFVTGNMYVEPDTNSTLSAAFRNAAGYHLLSIDTSTPSVTLNDDGIAADFRVESNLKPGAILVDGGTDQVAILTNGTNYNDAYADNISSTGRTLPSDIGLFISGAMGSKNQTSGNLAKGTTVVGGDLVSSGAVYINPAKTSTITPLTVRTPSGDALTVDSSMDVIINDAGSSNIDFRVESNTEEEAIFLDSSANKLYINKGETAFEIEMSNTNDTVFSINSLGACFNQDGNAAVDFRVESDNRQGAILVDGGADQIALLSNGVYASTSYADNISSTGRAMPSDISIFISGAMGSKNQTSGNLAKGTAVIGGDLVASGAVYINPAKTSTITPLTVRTPSGDALTVDSAMDVIINDAGSSNIDFRVESNTEDEAIFLDSSANKLYINKGETAFEVQMSNTNDSVFSINSVGATFNQDSHADIDFRVESDNRQGAILVDAGTDQIALLSNGVYASTSYADNVSPTGRALPSDISLFLSGAIGSKGQTQKATAVIGGDTVISGAFHINPAGDNTLPVAGLSTFSVNTVYGEALSVDSGLDVVINDAGNSGIDFRVESNTEDEAIFLDSSANKLYINKGETAFEVQMSNTNDQVMTINSLGVTFNQDGHANNDFRVESDNRQGAILVDAGTDQMVLLGNGVYASLSYADNVSDTGRALPSDIGLFVSGAIGGIGTTSGDAAKGTAVFGGDMVISGTIKPAKNAKIIQQHQLTFSWNNSGNEFYPKWGTTGYHNSVSSGNCYGWMVAPYSGSIRRLTLNCNANVASQTYGVDFYTAQTSGLSSTGTNELKDVLKGQATGSMAYRVPFILDIENAKMGTHNAAVACNNITGSFSFDAGDLIGFMFAITGKTGTAPSNTMITVAIEYDDTNDGW